LLSLDEIAGLSTNDAADQFADRYQARTRAFTEMGKLVWHLENRAAIPKGQTIYGILMKRGVPEGTVNNARLVEKFISAFVTPGLVTEARADEIITYRIVNQCARLTSGKSKIKMTADELAPLLNEGQKAAIGDELDSLDEHGLTIAGRNEAEAARKAEEKRIADLNAAAAALPPTPEPVDSPEQSAPADDAPAPVVVDGTKPETDSTTAPTAQAPAATENPAGLTVVPPATGETSSGSSSHETRPSGAAQVLAEIAEIELKSYDLDPEGLAAVRDKLAEWMDLIDSSLDNAKKSEPAKVA
jgi:hypothetical protein